MKRWMWWLGAGVMVAALFVVSNRGAAPGKERAMAHPEKTEDEPGVSAATSLTPRVAPDLKAADWKARWDDVRVDPKLASLGALGPSFSSTLAVAAGGSLADCARSLAAGFGATDLTVELFVEADPAGFRVVHAEVPTPGLEPWARRCVEKAFEQPVPLAHPGVAVGALYHLALPLRLQPMKPGPDE